MALLQDEGYEDVRLHSLDLLTGYLRLAGKGESNTVEVIERGGFLGKLTGATNSSKTSRIVTGLVNHTPADLGSDVDAIVPSNLPEEVRSNATDIQGETVAGLYNTDTAVAMATTRAVARLDLVVIYLRSFRNIIEHDLSDQAHLYNRFLNFFNEIFTELVHRLYTEELKQGHQIVSTYLECVPVTYGATLIGRLCSIW